jgi:O-antigen ligase
LAPALYFTWLAFSTFWDVSGGYRLRDIERYLVLFFVPPAMAVAPAELKGYIKKACMAFVAVTIVICILCLVKSYNEYLVNGDYRVFYYQYLGEQMGLNAIFLSNYCLACITWLLYFGFVRSKKHKPLIYVGIILSISFLLVMIFLLSSKLLIFLTLLVMMMFILVLGYVKGFFIRSILITGAVILAGVIAVTNLSYLSWRIRSTEIKTYQGEQDNQNGVAIRLYMWKTVGELIKERPVLGHGIRGGRLETLNRYREDGFEMGYKGDYHSHNQYLESMLMAGIPAIVLLLIIMLSALRNAVKNKNFLLLLMVAHFMIQSVFESTFEVQHELIFYIFFIFLFFYHGPHFSRIRQN